jgi:hypothetical protein
MRDVNAGLKDLLERLASLARDSDLPADAPGSPSAARTELPYPALTREGELPTQGAAPAQLDREFFPIALQSLAGTHLEGGEIEAIVLRLLMLRGALTGVELSQHMGLPFVLTERLLSGLKVERFVAAKSSATPSDNTYEITDSGLERARESAVDCSYCGTVPLSLADYAASVAAQSVTRARPRLENLNRAFADLTISRELIFRLGRALTSGRGLFLHGPPGNGKTSIAERIAATYGASIWIPRAISVCGEIISLFDPSCHAELPILSGERAAAEEKIDRRWVRIRRPTIMVGSDLTMSSLEVTARLGAGISDAPLQMKSNGGILVIDDFGRQRESPQRLLNRWIVPLEKRQDYLRLASGRKICVPFDPFVVFSTNLDPKALVDEAFLRRIPHKIEVQDPTVGQFRKLFEATCRKEGITFDNAAVDYLIARHYEAASRPMRFCHPRDLLHQVSVFCRMRGLPPAISPEALDAAATDYFDLLVH